MKYLLDYDAVGATMVRGIGVIHQTFLPQGQLGGLTGRAIMGLMPPAGKGDGKAAGVRRDRRPRRPETPEVGEGRFRVAARATVRSRPNGPPADIGIVGADIQVALVRVYNDFKTGFFAGDAAATVAFNVKVLGRDGGTVFSKYHALITEPDQPLIT